MTLNRHLVSNIIILLLVITHPDYAAAHAQQNIISASGKSIVLAHWQITKDPAPKDILQNPADSAWQAFTPSLDADSYIEGNWLIKTEIVIADSVGREIALGLFPVNFITAFEIYWDGVKLVQNGTIGINATDEKAGMYNIKVPISPALLTVGKHTIILRISNYQNYPLWKWYYGGLIIGPYDAGSSKIFRSGYLSFFIIGILFIPFLFNLFLYFARKRRTEHLLFSLICLLVILDSLTSQIPSIINVQTTFIFGENFIYRLITIIYAILFPVFIIYLFSFPKRITGIIIAVNLFIAVFLTNLWNIFSIMSLTVLIESSVLSIWAVKGRRKESVLIFIGMLISWGAFALNFAFAGLATVMVICTSISIARQFALKERAEKEAQLKSAHLENELLKKNINPHFILNTLTSIIVWLRKDPQSAIKLIETLAEEFRMITQISPLKQIPIRQEIDLCRAHLKIMSYRKGSDYNLETIDIVEEENVPPMIFHTLVENGLTHGYENKNTGTFILQRRKNSNCVQYILSNDGDFSNGEQKNSSGFGIKYIKSRLEESYPNRWELISHCRETGWETIIEIKDK